MLLGNHEVMNLSASSATSRRRSTQTFADAESESRRERAWAQYEELAAARAKARPAVPEVYAKTKEAWLAAHPPGWLEYREAFSPGALRQVAPRQAGRAPASTARCSCMPGPDPLGTALDVDAIDTPGPRGDRAHGSVPERAVAAKLALPFFTLQEMLEASAPAEIRAVNAVMAASKGTGRAARPSRLRRRRPEAGARRSLSIARVVRAEPERADVVPGLRRRDAEASLREPVAGFLAKNDLSRIVVGHTPSGERRISRGSAALSC